MPWKVMKEFSDPMIIQMVAVISKKTPAVRNVSINLFTLFFLCSVIMATEYAISARLTMITPAISIGLISDELKFRVRRQRKKIFLKPDYIKKIRRIKIREG